MEWNQVQSEIRGEDHHLFRVYKAYTSEARLALFQVLSWGCPKIPSQTFGQYLAAAGLNQTCYRRTFDGQQRKKISINPSGDRFDVSLLYKMIQSACHSLASPGDAVWTTPDSTRLEYLLTHIKNSRNSLVHDIHVTTKETMVEEIETLRDLLTRVVKGSGALYCVNTRTVEEVVRRINHNLTNIRDQPFAPLDLEDYRSHLLFDSLRATLRHNGARELKQIYSSKIFLDPLSFLDKSECHLRVGAVFISLLIHDLRVETRPHCVHYQELLEHCDASTPESETENGSHGAQDEAQKSSMMILEGQPGSGKTTLLRLYMSEWIAGGGDIRTLSDYDLVLHFECRNPCIDTLTQLLLSHMPQTTTKFRKNDLLQIFLSLKVMILIDGLDELNSASQKVLREILYLKTSCDLTLICTTRTEKIREVYKMASGRVRVIHMKIQGIPVEKREEFVRVYHQRLLQRSVTQQDVDSLLEYLRQVPSYLQDFFMFPLNLVLFTFLWDGAHARVKRITSMTALYLETHTLLIEKLLERMMYHPSTEHLPLAKLSSKCDSFLAVMYEEALRALADGVVYLDKEAAGRLRKHCVSLSLPAEEMFSAFLVSVSSDNALAHFDELSFPHKGIQDFYAARHVTLHLIKDPFPDLSLFLSELENLLSKTSVPTFPGRLIVKHTRQILAQPVTIRSVLIEFQQQQSQSWDLGRYQHVICHLVNLLHSSGRDALEYYAEEVVSLLAAAKGMSFEHWVDVLKEGHYNSILAGEISRVLSKFSWTVRDEHVEAAFAFLIHNGPLQLTIDIMGDPKKVPHLHDLLKTAASRRCKTYLYLHHHWRHPESGLSDFLLLKLVSAERGDPACVPLSSTALQDALSPDYISPSAAVTVARSTDGTAVSADPKIHLVEMMGRLSGLVVQMLPTSLKELRLAIADDHDALDWFGALPMLAHNLLALQSIWLHVAPGVTPDLLPNLPQLKYRPRLYLSGVGDDSISWASRVARALLPPSSKYASVGLVGSSLSSRGTNQLVARLHHLAVGVYGGRGGGLFVASSHLTVADLEDVRSSVLRYLRCPFALLDDEEIWFDESIYEEVYEYCMDGTILAGRSEDQRASGNSVHNSHGSAEIYMTLYSNSVDPPLEGSAYVNFKTAEEMHVSKGSASGSNESIYELLPVDGDTQGISKPSPPPPPLPPRRHSSTNEFQPPTCDPSLKAPRTHVQNSLRPPASLPPSRKPDDPRPEPHPHLPETAYPTHRAQPNPSKPFIPQPLSFIYPHQPDTHIPKPAIPLPLSPRLTRSSNLKHLAYPYSPSQSPS